MRERVWKIKFLYHLYLILLVF